MKKILFVIGSFLSLTTIAQVKMPAPSPTQTLTQEFGLGKIEIVYSRPSLKGRSVFGAGSLLAPIGDVWRTGANGATKLTFSDPVTIGGKTLPEVLMAYSLSQVLLNGLLLSIPILKVGEALNTRKQKMWFALKLLQKQLEVPLKHSLSVLKQSLLKLQLFI